MFLKKGVGSKESLIATDSTRYVDRAGNSITEYESTTMIVFVCTNKAGQDN